jgi:hypothetical protein
MYSGNDTSPDQGQVITPSLMSRYDRRCQDEVQNGKASAGAMRIPIPMTAIATGS